MNDDAGLGLPKLSYVVAPPRDQFGALATAAYTPDLPYGFFEDASGQWFQNTIGMQLPSIGIGGVPSDGSGFRLLAGAPHHTGQEFWDDPIGAAASAIGDVANDAATVCAVLGIPEANMFTFAAAVAGKASIGDIIAALKTDYTSLVRDKGAAEAFSDGDYEKAWNIATDNGRNLQAIAQLVTPQSQVAAVGPGAAYAAAGGGIKGLGYVPPTVGAGGAKTVGTVAGGSGSGGGGGAVIAIAAAAAIAVLLLRGRK